MYVDVPTPVDLKLSTKARFLRLNVILWSLGFIHFQDITLILRLALLMEYSFSKLININKEINKH